jgi:hypothetical protein
MAENEFQHVYVVGEQGSHWEAWLPGVVCAGGATPQEAEANARRRLATQLLHDLVLAEIYE